MPKYIVVQDCRASSRRPQWTPLSRPFDSGKDEPDDLPGWTALEMAKNWADTQRAVRGEKHGRAIFVVQVVDGPYA